MRHAARAAAAGIALSLWGVMPEANADDAADIRQRFEAWVEDFNAGRVAAACDLFSRDLVSTVRGQGDADYQTRCDIITRALTDPARSFHYDLDLHEVIVENDLAVVRLTWTLFLTPLNVTVVERGMDVLRREADGAWRIVRFIAYEEER